MTGAGMSDAERAATIAEGTRDGFSTAHDEMGLDPVATAAGRLAGRVETLLWCQAELKLELASLVATDRFADTRGLEAFLMRVQDSLKAVQDGSGAWAGLVRTPVGASDTGGTADDPVPTTEMGREEG